MNPELKNYYTCHDPTLLVDDVVTGLAEAEPFFQRLGWNFPDGAELMRGIPGFRIIPERVDSKFLSAKVILFFSGESYYKEFRYLKAVTTRRFAKDLKAWLKKTVPSGSGKDVKWVTSFSKKP